MTRELWEVFKVDYDKKEPWRVQMKKGILSFRRKKDAREFSDKAKKIG